jgi:hypothetical protein
VGRVASLTLIVAACSGGSDSDTHAHPAGGPAAQGQPDAPIAGPQGARAQFVVECGFSHLAPDDPIVFPGRPGMSHLHAFFGNPAVDAFTTAADLPGGDTTCEQPLDTAAYWAPTLLRDGQPLEPTKSTAYYRPGLGVQPASVQAYPAGLVMLAGNPAATSEQPVSIVAWTCGTGISREVLPPVCASGSNLRLIVTFPDCWDGSNLDSDDHYAHVAYSSGGQCPSAHRVPIPQLQFSVEYPVTGDASGLVLASGGLLTGHADFINGWDQAKLESEVALCLHRELVCGVASDGSDA